MGDVIHLPRGRTEWALYDDVVRIVRERWAGAITLEQAERDIRATMTCWPRIQRRQAQGMRNAG